MYAETNPESDLVLLESIRRHLLDIPDELPPETTSFGSGDLEAYKALHDAINVGWITFDQLDACGDTSGNDSIRRHLLDDDFDTPNNFSPETTSFGADLEAYKALHDAINVEGISFEQRDACYAAGNDAPPKGPVRVRNKRGSLEPSSSSSSSSSTFNDESPASKRRKSETNSVTRTGFENEPVLDLYQQIRLNLTYNKIG
ncbi:hypothetical protein JRO89_XS01G0017200 [Xanthoceras sorbifolium]|uniref:Uncharacterized protein n=1 Tax=Xanthoceras sorbifolium TaxID=99658 RepID=A0ABQ8IHV1_9ROSI|nr:hypothetical protein JRO89_XS01G0017200 [Xanthoceras sorbifolium]